MQKIRDLKPAKFQVSSWKTDEFTTSLESLYNYVTEQAERAREWYFYKRKRKKICGYILRIGATVAAAFAGIIPMLAEIYENHIEPGWASVSLGIAAFLIAIDKLGGFTSGWIRYVRTGQRLSQIEESFRFDWEKSKLIFKGNNPTVEQTSEVLSRCKAFLLEINSVVIEETELWANEFQGTLKEVEKAAKAQRK